MQIFYLPRDDIDRTMSVFETLYKRVLQHENFFKFDFFLPRDDRTMSVLETLWERVLKLEKEISNVSKLGAMLDSLTALAVAHTAEKNELYSIQLKEF